MGNLGQRLGALLLFGGTLRLRSYEGQCIDAWVESLPENARATLKRQLLRLDLYKRLKKGRLLQLFPTGWSNGVPLPSDLRLPLREDESRVARIRLTFSVEPELRSDAIVVLQNGQLTSLEFTRLPPHAASVPVQIRDITHLRDVSERSVEPGPPVATAGLPEEFAWLYSQYSVRHASPPRPEGEICSFLSSFDAALPRDYSDLLRKTNGFSAGPVVFYGIGGVLTVPRPDGPFLIMASIEDVGDLAVKVGDSNGAIYLLDAEADSVTPQQGGLVQALSLLCKKDAPRRQ